LRPEEVREEERKKVVGGRKLYPVWKVPMQCQLVVLVEVRL
jgi:hypothetical protein